jgi:hypothetical protein
LTVKHSATGAMRLTPMKSTILSEAQPAANG